MRKPWPQAFSDVGRGATMCLYLPRHDGQEDAAEAAAGTASPTSARRGESMLVVDDEPNVRMLVTEVLEDLGYAALEAADGDSALRVVQSTAGGADHAVGQQEGFFFF
jgi:hypothetical protein